MASLANSGSALVASLQPTTSGRVRAAVGPAPWEQGVHMEALANLAHELRSPVQAFLGYLDVLRDELREELSDRHRRVLDRLNANAHDLAQTVENVMDFSLSDAMAEATDEAEVRLDDLMVDLAPALEAANDCKGLKIGFDLGKAPAIFRSRLRPLKAILLNLALNAIKFTDRGSVTIAIRLVESSRLGYALELEVRDTGPGIAPEQLAQAFEPCAQLSHSSVRRHRGMGLGLAVVHRNAEALGATVLVKPVLPHGTAFVVTVPIASVANVSRAMH